MIENERLIIGYIRDILKQLNRIESRLNQAEILEPTKDQPQGEWVDRSDGGRILHPWWESCECSQCEEWGSGAWNFCPHCGARMKGADDD